MFSPYGSSYKPTFTSPTTAGPEGTAVEKVKRHPQYYLQGGDVHFLVEHYLFRVHSYFFERESAVFREKLAAPAAAGQPRKGSSDTNPFPLDDVRADDFSRFLWVFYNPKYSLYDATLDDWSVILKLSFDWRFGEVKKLACRELEKIHIEPVRKIALYQAYELDRKLLIASYAYLAQREDPLTLTEGRELGLETALLIATARECARGKPSSSGAHSPVPSQLPSNDLEGIVRRVFGLSGGPPSPSLSPVAAPPVNQTIPPIVTATATAPASVAGGTSTASAPGTATPAVSAAKSVVGNSAASTRNGRSTPASTRTHSPAPSVASSNPFGANPTVNSSDDTASVSTKSDPSTVPEANLLGGDSAKEAETTPTGATQTGQDFSVTRSPYFSLLNDGLTPGYAIQETPTRVTQRLTLILPGVETPHSLQLESPVSPLEIRTRSPVELVTAIDPVHQLKTQEPGALGESRGKITKEQEDVERITDPSIPYEVDVHPHVSHDQHAIHRTSSFSLSDFSMTVAGTEIDGDSTIDAGYVSNVTEDTVEDWHDAPMFPSTNVKSENTDDDGLESEALRHKDERVVKGGHGDGENGENANVHKSSVNEVKSEGSEVVLPQGEAGKEIVTGSSVSHQDVPVTDTVEQAAHVDPLVFPVQKRDSTEEADITDALEQEYPESPTVHPSSPEPELEDKANPSPSPESSEEDSSLQTPDIPVPITVEESNTKADVIEPGEADVTEASDEHKEPEVPTVPEVLEQAENTAPEQVSVGSGGDKPVIVEDLQVQGTTMDSVQTPDSGVTVEGKAEASGPTDVESRPIESEPKSDKVTIEDSSSSKSDLGESSVKPPSPVPANHPDASLAPETQKPVQPITTDVQLDKSAKPSSDLPNGDTPILGSQKPAGSPKLEESTDDKTVKAKTEDELQPVNADSKPAVPQVPTPSAQSKSSLVTNSKAPADDEPVQTSTTEISPPPDSERKTSLEKASTSTTEPKVPSEEAVPQGSPKDTSIFGLGSGNTSVTTLVDADSLGLANGDDVGAKDEKSSKEATDLESSPVKKDAQMEDKPEIIADESRNSDSPASSADIAKEPSSVIAENESSKKVEPETSTPLSNDVKPKESAIPADTSVVEQSPKSEGSAANKDKRGCRFALL